MNKKIITGVIAVVVISGTFYGGMAYGKSTVTTRGEFNSGQFPANASGARGSGIRGGVNGGFTTGEIISKDATSVTIKMQDGSTKIALIASSTQVMKSSSGALNDLIIGTNITITGTSNSDGSVTAKSVQIRPEGLINFGSRNN